MHFSQSVWLLPLHPSILHRCGIAKSLGCDQWSKLSYDIHGLARLLVLFSYSEPESSLAGFEKWVGQSVAFDLSQLCIALPLHVPERITNQWYSSFCCTELLPALCFQSMSWQDSLKLDEEWLLVAISSLVRP